MSQIIELKWEKSALEIKNVVDSYQIDIPKGFTKNEFNEIKNLLRKKIEKLLNINLDNKKIYATGHQPDVHHPGILTKDLILYYLSQKNQAFPIHLVVDTDYFEFEYFYPIPKGNFAELHLFSAHSHSTFHTEKVEETKRKELLEILQSQKKVLDLFLDPETSNLAKYYLDIYISKIEQGELLHNINEQVRRDFLFKLGIEIPCLNVSEIVRLDEFLFFVEKIRSRLNEFIQIHNQALLEYRQKHKIKNHAQPIPNLKEGEMPFWKYENKERVSFSSLETPKIIFPRAITLTMFVRIFLCNFFLHGKGGARYESVSDQIIQKFFEIKPSPYEVTTSTLYLKNKNGFLLPKWDEKELERKLREIHFSPEKFLPTENELVKEKKNLQVQFQDPTQNKKELHEKITLLNQKLEKLVLAEKELLEKEKKDLPYKLKTKQVFETRKYPFFYYNLQELIDKIKNIIYK